MYNGNIFGMNRTTVFNLPFAICFSKRSRILESFTLPRLLNRGTTQWIPIQIYFGIMLHNCRFSATFRLPYKDKLA